jgi:hypothetical protein
MKTLILTAILLISASTTASFAKVEEFSPVKVLVDTDRGVVLREPTALDYDNAILDKETATKDRSVWEKIFKKPCGAARFHL